MERGKGLIIQNTRRTGYQSLSPLEARRVLVDGKPRSRLYQNARTNSQVLFRPGESYSLGTSLAAAKTNNECVTD
jgi:hypothetical protein